MATPQKTTSATRSTKMPLKKRATAKATTKAKTKTKDPVDLKASPNPRAVQDPAHSPGHRKLKVKDDFKDSSGEKKQSQKSALNRLTKADVINRSTAQIRMSGFVNSAGARRRKGSKTAH